MLNFRLQGQKPLNGTIVISGSKNAALPAMTAALLADTPTTLTNVPDIRDVHSMAEILRSIGAEVEQIDNHTWKISGSGVTKTAIDYLLGRRLRASILLLGPLLARWGEIRLPHPGGCVIGKRPVGTHFEAMRGLGATVDHEGDFYIGRAPKLTGSYLYLDEVSVTATENAVMAATLASGTTTIRPAAMEPHVVNLCQLLVKMGAKIEGIGTHSIVIHGVQQLHGTEHQINSDEIEVGTFIAAALMTNGRLTLKNIPDDLDPILYKFRQLGANIEIGGGELTVRRGNKLESANLQVDTWPRFPTDLQPQFGALATQAEGTSVIHEWMYENRLKYTESLIEMGANITVNNSHEAIITGPTPLHGAAIDSPDLRSGIAFVLAGLTASGTTTISHAELILRGYERLEEKLRAVGATIDQFETPDLEETHATATTGH